MSHTLVAAALRVMLWLNWQQRLCGKAAPWCLRGSRRPPQKVCLTWCTQSQWGSSLCSMGHQHRACQCCCTRWSLHTAATRSQGPGQTRCCCLQMRVAKVIEQHAWCIRTSLGSCLRLGRHARKVRRARWRLDWALPTQPLLLHAPRALQPGFQKGTHSWWVGTGDTTHPGVCRQSRRGKNTAGGTAEAAVDDGPRCVRSRPGGGPDHG